jgi:hypothetical protein
MKVIKRFFLTASAVCAVTALTAPSAHADVCGSGLSLPAGIWTMFSAPCAPPAGSATVNDQFNADLGPGAAYNTTWIMFKWDPNAGIAGEYVQLNSGDPLEQDTGYWIYSTKAGTLKIDNGTHTTGDMKTTGTDDGYYGDCGQFGWTDQPCYKIDLAVPGSAGETKWNLVGYPFVRSTQWADVHVAKSTDGGTTWTDVGAPSAADTAGLISKNGYVFNDGGNTYIAFDDTVASPSANILQPNKSYWFQSRYVAGVTKIALLVPAPRYTIFITSTNHNGALGGLTGADTICQLRSYAGSVASGQYRAWLSAQTTDVASRVDHSGPYYGSMGNLVATSWDDLTDGQIATPIYGDEAGTAVAPSIIWTGSHDDGTATGEDCSGWTSNAATVAGGTGDHEVLDAWSYIDDVPHGCDRNLKDGIFPYKIYCIDAAD